MKTLLRNGRLVDPSCELDTTADLLIDGTRITAVGPNLQADADTSIDCTDKVVVPGLIDLHVHLREPGQEYKETIETGSRAAAKGGFTGICPMPNTKPACDDGSRVEFVNAAARRADLCHVYPVGAITSGREGVYLAEMGDMVAHGAVAFSDDGRGVQNDGVMRRAMDYAKMFPRVLMSHCQREDLTGPGVVNEGVVSTRLGMAGWPAQAEEIQIARDIELCRLTGCPLHIQHLTTAHAVDLVRQAKKEGLPVTCEVTPHHLFLCEDDITSDYDTNLKVNPPLRTREDRDALQQALIDGDIDCVSSDHAPHAAHEKALEFELAPFGTLGLETSLSLMLTHLVLPGRMTWQRLVECMAIAPRTIIDVPFVMLAAGSPADITVIDPEVRWTPQEGGFVSRSQNSAFIGHDLIGCACDVFVDGKQILASGALL